MQETWVNKARLYEILATAFECTTPDTAKALREGEYIEQLSLFASHDASLFDLKGEVEPQLAPYTKESEEVLLRRMRTEYTRLFVGAPKALVSPYAGIWYARDKGLDPLLFVNKESMGVERFMRRCGITRPENLNEPLDHISSELEFLSYLCLNEAGVLELPEGVSIDDSSYNTFYRDHFSDWPKQFAQAVCEESTEPFFIVFATILMALPKEPW